MRSVPAVRRVAVTAFVLAVAVTGCSGGDSQAGSGASVSPDVRAYYSCLEKNGLALETSDGGQPRVDKDKNDEKSITTAEKQCRDLLPAQSTQASAEDLATARALSECVRKKGFKDYPDPDPKTGEIELDSKAAAALKTEPGLAAALQECRPGGDGADDSVAGG